MSAWTEEARAILARPEEAVTYPCAGRVALQHGDAPRSGDTLHADEAAARAEWALMRRQAAARLRMAEEAEAASVKRAEAEAARVSLDGYEDTLTPMQRGRAVKSLLRQVRNGGRIISRRDLVRELVREGWRPGARGLEAPGGDTWIEAAALTSYGLEYAAHLIKIARAVKSRTVLAGG